MNEKRRVGVLENSYFPHRWKLLSEFYNKDMYAW